MTNMRQYLAWVQQNQKNNPEWRDANVWQRRNQTEIKEKPKPNTELPEGTEIVNETPKE